MDWFLRNSNWFSDDLFGFLIPMKIIGIRMNARGLSGGSVIREIYASSYGESHGVRVQIIGIRMGPRECSGGEMIRQVYVGFYETNTQNV